MDTDYIDSKAYARMLGITRNSLYRASNKAYRSGDKESLYYPTLVRGNQKFYSKTRLLNSAAQAKEIDGGN